MSFAAAMATPANVAESRTWAVANVAEVAMVRCSQGQHLLVMPRAAAAAALEKLAEMKKNKRYRHIFFPAASKDEEKEALEASFVGHLAMLDAIRQSPDFLYTVAAIVQGRNDAVAVRDKAISDKNAALQERDDAIAAKKAAKYSLKRRYEEFMGEVMDRNDESGYISLLMHLGFVQSAADDDVHCTNGALCIWRHPLHQISVSVRNHEFDCCGNPHQLQWFKTQLQSKYHLTILERSQIGSRVSGMSMLNLISAAGSDCFLGGALFQIPGNFFVRASDLFVGSFICAAGGGFSSSGILTITSIVKVPKQQQDLVDLQTRSACLAVTATHRVVVQRRSGPQTVQASGLRVGDQVLIGSGGSEELIHVEPYTASVEIVQILFTPDEPVEALHPPRSGVLSKGHGFAKTRRGARKHTADRAPSPASSVAATDDSWMYEY